MPLPTDENLALHELFGPVVPLHKDLAECLSDASMGFACLRHPLVYAVPYFEQENGRLNRLLDRKKKCLEEAIESRDLRTYVAAHERPYRLEALQSYASKAGFLPEESATYWSVLGWAWCDSENIHENHDAWIECWNDPPQAIAKALRVASMDASERTTWDALPDEIEVFHGEERDGEIGWSWSLSQDVALWFASRFSQDAPRATFSGTVRKQDVIVYLDRRGEQEIIVNPDDVKIGPPIDPENLPAKRKKKVRP